MLGVSQAATIGINFQCAYSGGAINSYSGSPITATAFGVSPSGWESLTPMPTGYGDPAGPYSFTEVIDTTTSTNGLHALPKGALTINWSALCANVSGYHGNDTAYGGNSYHSGEQQVFWGFMRDGVTFGPGATAGDNNQAGYSVDIAGLKSLFTGSGYVVQTIAATDSGFGITNVFLIDPSTHSTNSIAYPNIAPPDHLVGDVAFPRGIMGGISEASVALSADHLQVIGNRAAHGDGFNNSSTLSGIIITDQPLIEYGPQTPAAPFNTGDSTTLSVQAIGVPPLAYQWRKNGVAIPGATGATYDVSSVSAANSGNYDVVVSNSFGSATSKPAIVSDQVLISARTGIIVDSKGILTPYNGNDFGTGWLATSVGHTGVADFTAAAPSHITLPAGTTNLDSPVGTISFWIRSPGLDNSDGFGKSASLFNRREGAGLDILQNDDGTLSVQVDGANNSFTSTGTVSDNNWHLITVTYDQSDTGFVSLYIDGIADSGNVTNGNPWTWPAGQPVWLGASRRGLWRAFVGQLDDFRLYSRILSDADILLLSTPAGLTSNARLEVQFNFDTAPASGLSVGWLNGSLQSPVGLTGPFVDVPVLSPYAVLPTEDSKFYGVRP